MKQLNSTIFIITVFLSIGICTHLDAQTDDQAAASGYISDSQEFWDNTPLLVLSPESEALTPPTEVNNSDYFYFPRWENDGDKYIYSQQQNGSCAAVSSVFYTFSYEINRVRGVPGLFDENKYPPNFTWNFLNDGIYEQGSSFFYNLKILKENGVPNSVQWGNLDPTDYLRWMDGYEKYHNSHFNRIKGYSKIEDIYEVDNFMLLKHWIADHNEGTSTGGLAVFGVVGACAPEVNLPPESAHAGDIVTIEWGTECNHAITIVGYCDDIKYDINGDGQFTNNVDLNNDGLLDIRDWETGAFNIVGQGGPEYAQEGFVWIMYKTIAEAQMSFSGGLAAARFIVLDVDDEYEPLIEVKAKIQHPYRHFYGHKIASALKADQIVPTPGSYAFAENVFNYRGGDNPLHGINNNPVEIGIDFSYWFIEEDFGKIFFRPKETGSVNYYGIVEEMSIIDYRWNEEFELYSDQENVYIPHGTNTNTIFVDYDLIPHESIIEGNLTFDSDMVSRFNPTVSNGATLTIDEGVNIDMYESELKVLQTSSLIIKDDATFTAKKGICKIVVDGTVNIGSNVSFTAEEGAQLQLVLNNSALALEIIGGTFDRAAIISYIDDLTISGNSSFTDGGIYGFNGDYSVSKVSFDNSFCLFSDAGHSNNTISIVGCSFFDTGLSYPVKIEDYPDFIIDDCVFTDNFFGIYIYNSGDGTNSAEISNCEISGCNQSGIQIYDSYVDIVSNTISDNFFGIRSFNNSKVKLEGNHQVLTQTIQDNTIYEVYASNGSFPYYFHYNGIIDEDNQQPMVYYSGSSEEIVLDVSNNYWGNNFNASTDLFPNEPYIYLPIWDPGKKSGSVVESLYNSAQAKIGSDDFDGAKIDLLEIISQYPETMFAGASLKDIFAIEGFCGNDYASLQVFLESDPVIQNYGPLAKLAAFFSNKCEIKLQNWQNAISYFEGVINNPESFEDSLFAIIDLGHTYLLMENGGFKSAYTGNMAGYIPASVEEYEKEREFLLSLLPGDQMSKEMMENINRLEDGELLQNVPNPFSKSTQIWFNINARSNVVINVYGYTGKKLNSIKPGTLEKGRHSVGFSANDLPGGVYFYSIEINGVVSDTKKMTILK